MEEIWKDIEGYEGLYEVSSFGRVRSLDRYDSRSCRISGRILKPIINLKGYCRIGLSKDGKAKMFQLHRLVAQAFIPNPYNLPQINHKDENKQNNCVDNLEWCTQKYNINYGTHNERVKQHHGKPTLGKFGKKHHNSKPINQYTKDGEFVKSWDSIMDVERGLGIFASSISYCAKGIYKTAGGYIWRYIS